MSTKLRDVPNTKHKTIRQTRFAGGQTFHGSALQITMHHEGGYKYIAVSREDALKLGLELIRFANFKEIEDE